MFELNELKNHQSKPEQPGVFSILVLFLLLALLIFGCSEPQKIEPQEEQQNCETISDKYMTTTERQAYAETQPRDSMDLLASQFFHKLLESDLAVQEENGGALDYIDPKNLSLCYSVRWITRVYTTAFEEAVIRVVTPELEKKIELKGDISKHSIKSFKLYSGTAVSVWHRDNLLYVFEFKDVKHILWKLEKRVKECERINKRIEEERQKAKDREIIRERKRLREPFIYEFTAKQPFVYLGLTCPEDTVPIRADRYKDTTGFHSIRSN